ncbi:lasso peptide isopeptide bond-forming cyclase [Kibdelosporangium lantanae]
MAVVGATTPRAPTAAELTRLWMVSRMRQGFLVLPDRDHDLAVTAMSLFESAQTITHRSGRPWVVGRWAPGSVVEAHRGDVHAVLLGSGDAGALGELVAATRDLGDVDRAVDRLAGSYHLLVSAAGKVRLQGGVTGLTRVYVIELSGVPVAADRADLLAALTGADIDTRLLTARMACNAPAPLREMSLWSGVRAVPPDHYLRIDATSTSTVRWWRPPEPDVPLAAGAARLRAELRAAVAAREPVDGRLGADLSGGLDSSSLCFLAAERTPGLLTFRWGEADGANDDAYYAARAAESLPEANHLVTPNRELPTVFADVGGHDVDPEQPETYIRTAARMRATARLLAGNGISLHIAGHGGDELFNGYPGYLHRMLRRHPTAAVRRLREYRALYRWPVVPTARALLAGTQPRDWWAEQADHLTDPLPGRAFVKLGWGTYPLRVPPWATADAVALTRAALRDAAESAEPLASDRGQHQCLLQLRTSAAAFRQLAGTFAESGVRLETPFMDDRVVNAATAVRFHERSTPWQYKALLSQAMSGVVPRVLLARSTKGEFSADLRAGFGRNRGRILGYFADSLLAEHGLLDRDRLRMHLMAPQVDNSTMAALERLIGCEAWLRVATRKGAKCG